MSSPSIDRVFNDSQTTSLYYQYLEANPTKGSLSDEEQSAKDRAEAYTCGRKPYPADMFAVLRKVLGKHADVLDIGCGNGRSTLPMKKLWTKNVVGYDYDKQMLNELERVSLEAEAKIETKRGNVTDLGVTRFGKRRFDAVCAFSAFSLFKDDERAVKAILSVLKPNGVFIDAGDEGTKNDPLGQLMKDIVKIALDRDLVTTPMSSPKPALSEQTILAKHNFVPLRTYRFQETEFYNFEETFAHFKSREIFRKQKFSILELNKISEALTNYFEVELKNGLKAVVSKYYCTIYVRKAPQARL